MKAYFVDFRHPEQGWVTTYVRANSLSEANMIVRKAVLNSQDHCPYEIDKIPEGYPYFESNGEVIYPGTKEQ